MTETGALDQNLRALLDAAPDGFLVADSKGRVVFVNRTAESLFGYEHAELDGSMIEDLVAARLRDVHVRHRSDYQENPRVRPMGFGINLVGRRKDGSEFPVEISLSPIATAEGPLVTAVIRDVTERKRLEEERNLLSIELETERERDRIAMDLHDGIMQDIYAAALTLELASADAKTQPEESRIGVERAIDQLHEVVRNIRSYIFDLRPREFSGDLARAIRDLAQEFEQNSQIETVLEIEEGGTAATPVAVAIYQIAHETLSNIQRHARASRVSLSLRFSEADGRLDVRDNGVGFDTSSRVSEDHRGLRNMAARATAVKAMLELTSVPGQGTHTAIVFPVLNPEEVAES